MNKAIIKNISIIPTTFFLVLFLVLSINTYGQTKNKTKKRNNTKKEVVSVQDCPKAEELLTEAHNLIVEKQYWVAKEKLEKAIILCPEEEIKYKYELAWDYYLMKEFRRTIDVLTPIASLDNAPSDIFQLMGNAYDGLNNEAMALVTYNKGLERYPNAGCLFLEKGNLAQKRSNFLRALEYYETGIEKDPSFASNYYRASQIFLSSSEEVWGMIYGELFVNLEKQSQRHNEICQRLYDTYHSEITFNLNQIRVNFNDPTIVYSDSKTRPNLFPDAYENALLKAAQGYKNITLSSIINIRRKFIDIFYSLTPEFKNLLFDYHKTLIKLGYFEAYNYWLFGEVSQEESQKWIEKNKAKYNNFLKWMDENPLIINTENSFSRYKME
ncbi:MAG: hypothetical protein LBM25_07605 [Bacteroidales bacterium]|jgi:tetratricopeptide (TPR) repeat protein|nr:hypothetical protein [Bacteroidales bacterium]